MPIRGLFRLVGTHSCKKSIFVSERLEQHSATGRSWQGKRTNIERNGRMGEARRGGQESRYTRTARSPLRMWFSYSRMQVAGRPTPTDWIHLFSMYVYTYVVARRTDRPISDVRSFVRVRTIGRSVSLPMLANLPFKCVRGG